MLNMEMDNTVLVAVKEATQLLTSRSRASRLQGIDTLHKYFTDDKALPDKLAKAVATRVAECVGIPGCGRAEHHRLQGLLKVLATHAGAQGALGTILLQGARGHGALPCVSVAHSRHFLPCLEAVAAVWHTALRHNAPTDTGHSLAHATALYHSLSVASGCGAVVRRATNAVLPLWRDDVARAAFVKVLSVAEPSVHELVSGGHFLHFLRTSGIADSTGLRTALLKAYVATVFQTKTKLTPLQLHGYTALLAEASASDVSDILLPAVKRCLLRCPEAVLAAVEAMADGLRVNLSPHVDDLGKGLMAPLHHQDDNTRALTITAVAAVSRRLSSDVGAVTRLANTLLDVYTGADGKLTVTTQKVSVLEAVEAVSLNRVEDCSAVLESILPKWMKLVEAESHEGSLLAAMSLLRAWLLRAPSCAPKAVWGAVGRHVALKAWTPLVRTGYWRALRAGPGRAGADVVKVALKQLAKASAGVTQMNMQTEALAITSYLLSVSAADPSLDSCVAPLWTSALNFSQEVFFTTPKFLDACDSDALCDVTCVLRVLLTTRLSVEQCGVLYRCLAACLCWHGKTVSGSAPPGTVREAARAVLWSVLCMPARAQQLPVFTAALANHVQLQDGGSISPAGIEHMLRLLPGCLLNKPTTDFSLPACTLPPLSQADRDAACLALLPVCCCPTVALARPGLWPVLCTQLEVSPKDVVERNSDAIVRSYTKNYRHSATSEACVRELCRCAGITLYPALVNYLASELEDPRLLEVSQEDLAIFRTPEDELYGQYLVDEAFEMNIDTKHVKKTNKTYTHEDHVFMLEEKKAEIERKRAAGTLELTQKQKEVKKAQTEKEDAVRKRMADIMRRIPDLLSLLEGLVANADESVLPSLTPLVCLFSNYFSSPVVGAEYAKLFCELSGLVIVPEHAELGILIGQLTPRLLGADENVLPADWLLGDSVNEKEIRAMELLYTATVPDAEVMAEDFVDMFWTAPAFVYCFPLIRHVLDNIKYVTADRMAAAKKEQNKAKAAAKAKKQKGDAGSDDEEAPPDDDLFDEDSEPENDKVTKLALQIISEHMCMRGESDAAEDLHNPRLLPLKLLMELMIRTIGCCSTGVVSEACSVLCEVCTCCAGGPGCYKATHEELSTLINTLTATSAVVREAALTGLQVLDKCVSTKDQALCQRVWVTRHDVSEDVCKQADILWEKLGMEVTVAFLPELRKDLLKPQSCVREAAAQALAALLKQHPAELPKTVDWLISNYKSFTKITPEKRDHLDHQISPAIDHWEQRSGVALALSSIGPQVSDKTVSRLVSFYVPEALGDRNQYVANQILDAATVLVTSHGKEYVGTLLPVFEKCLNSAPKHASFDRVRQAVIVLMGGLAKHLDPSSPKVKPIVLRLIEALSTPSQAVQEAVALCLPPLIPAIKEECPKMITKMLSVMLTSEKYGEKRGAAYGLASLVKGLGILSLKQHDVIPKLTEGMQNKKHVKYREGALFGIEQLCMLLGKLFEPYIVSILPDLLICYGDISNHVRKAAKDTAKAVMSKLSAHGVKLILPSLLKALEEDNWRTKQGSVQLLGSMAFCAPKQLSSCLPSVVPRLIEVLSDSHVKVQHAGAEALRLIGSVIKNPEVQAIVPVLLSALQNPARMTSRCLKVLLHTKFVHFIDAPSLALIMPVVERAFQDRRTETRKMSAQIIGNMYSLTDAKDLTPYLPAIIPGLKASLLDPVPKVRSVSARALGAMVRGIGESSFDELMPWLMSTLTSEQSNVDRSGAAQGFAEILGGLGTAKLHRLMPDIVATAERCDISPYVKDGYLMLFIFLPSVFQDEFTSYIGQIIPAILTALAEETEFVRDTALRAGQRIVTMYSQTSIDLLLPELEGGLFNDNWRIRFSSVKLLGDLLYKISGVTGKMTTDTAHEDDNLGTEASQAAILEALGDERRNRVLAGLYMGRSDVALLVRQAALHVWKVVVSNTPKTLREVLPTLFTLLLGCLASTSYDKRQVAARTLGDLVRKLGERVLPEIFPILEEGLKSEDADHRQGVCVGLSEIMANSSREMVLSYTDTLVPTVRTALCDPLPDVRAAAASTFDALHTRLGQKALDDTLPPLLEMMKGGNQESEEAVLRAEYALDGLKQVMAVKSRVVLPYLIPQLTSHPVNTEALCIMASVAGEALTKHLSKILPALVTALSDLYGTDGYQDALTHSQGVVFNVTDPAGVNIILDELLTVTKTCKTSEIRAATHLLVAFTTNPRGGDLSAHTSQLLRGLLQLFTSKDEATLKAAHQALTAVTASMDTSDQRACVVDMRQAVKFAASDLKPGQFMPGFCLPKGIAPILPVYRESILNGEAELKELASLALTEVIHITAPESLKSSVIQVTGPLIRILGDRFAASVKCAVLDTIGLLLAKTGPMLKAFLPQLQTTFIKAIRDPSRGVRMRVGNALAHLVAIHTKPEPMFQELLTVLRQEESQEVRETTIMTTRQVFILAGAKIPEQIREGLVECLLTFMVGEQESTRPVAAGAVAAALPAIPAANLHAFVKANLLAHGSADVDAVHGRVTCLAAAVKLSYTQLLTACPLPQLQEVLVKLLTGCKEALVLQSCAVAIGYLLQERLKEGEALPQDIVVPFSRLINHQSNDVKQAMCRSVQYVCEALAKGEALPIAMAKTLVPALVNGTKEKNQVVKSGAEMALIALLALKEGDQGCQRVVGALEGGMKEAFTECVQRSLRKAVYYPVTVQEMDSTMLV